ncbi:L-rhamnose-binding lectin CSL2-like, partial [Clupea harengus]|uniref:L-rhamnose-binding lectin CSL2-like n=1 Tax=Clupea harengus TaxID=7950 RepID=A0A8M1KED9_CLUHA
GSKTSLLSIHQLQSFTCLSKYNICPSNPGSNVIHIHKANYGRTDKTTCSSGRPANQLSNTNCYAPTTLPIIRDRCEGKTTCAVQASHLIFSDPCGGIYKYLDISPAKYVIASMANWTVVCSNVIHIHKANYGRTDKTTCSSGRPANQLSNTNCYAPTTLPIIRDRCEGKTTCAVQASHLIFSDPCGGIYKYLDISYSYLDISYSCVPPSSNVIRIHTASYGRTDKTTCSSGRPANQLIKTDCSASTTLPIVRERCDGKERCTVMASSDIFPDRCPDTYKNLDISYSCVTEIMQ